MRIRIDGIGRTVAPGHGVEIAERLEALNTPDKDIFEARMSLEAPANRVPCDKAVKVELLLAARTLSVTRGGSTLQDAVEAVLGELERQLQTFRHRFRRQRAAPPPLETP